MLDKAQEQKAATKLEKFFAAMAHDELVDYAVESTQQVVRLREKVRATRELRQLNPALASLMPTAVVVGAIPAALDVAERLRRAIRKHARNPERVAHLVGARGGGRGGRGVGVGSSDEDGGERGKKKYLVEFAPARGASRRFTVKAISTAQARMVARRRVKRDGEETAGATFNVTRAR